MAMNFKLPTITTTIQEVAVCYPQPDGTTVDGVLVTQYKILNKSDTDVISKQLKEREEKGESVGEVELKTAYLAESVLGITNVVDDNGVPRIPEDAKRMCLDNPITRGALWDGYIKVINKSSTANK